MHFILFSYLVTSCLQDHSPLLVTHSLDSLMVNWTQSHGGLVDDVLFAGGDSQGVKTVDHVPGSPDRTLWWVALCFSWTESYSLLLRSRSRMCIESLYVFIRFLVYIIYTYLLIYVSFIHTQNTWDSIYIATLGILPVIFERNPQDFTISFTCCQVLSKDFVEAAWRSACEARWVGGGFFWVPGGCFFQFFTYIPPSIPTQASRVDCVVLWLGETPNG